MLAGILSFFRTSGASPAAPEAAYTYRQEVFYTLCRQRQVAYLNIYKCGTITFKSILLRLDGVQVDDPLKVNWINHYNQDCLPDNPLLRDCFRFTFVRHPLERMVAVFLEKLSAGSRAERDFSRFGMHKGMPIEQFVDCLVRVPAAEMDAHLRPQTDLLFYRGEMRVDFVGRLERAERDYERIRPILGDPAPLPRLNTNPRSEERARWRHLLPPDSLRKAADYYQRDLAVLGYSV